MIIIPDVPDRVARLINAHLEALLLWFSEYVYTQILKRADNHLLVKVHGHLDFAPLEKACVGYHHTSGPGAPPTHGVPRLVRALVVKYLLNCSLRQLEYQIRYNLLVKWFVGYPIFADGPDHSTLDRFELWVCEHQHRTFFDEVLYQIDADFPEDREQPQIGDTFAMQADAAPESLVRLIRHTCERLLASLVTVDVRRHAAVVEQLNREALFGPDDETNPYYLSSTERHQRLHTTVQAAFQCINLVECQLVGLPEQVRQPIAAWCERLHKIFDDELAIQCDADGRVEHVAALPDDQTGSYRIASATDPDATFRVHDDNVQFGYNISIAATPRFIREIRADTGAQPDPVALPDLLSAQRDYHELLPPKLIYDAAAGTGKTRFLVHQTSDGETQLVSPLINYASRSERFGPNDFTLSDDGSALTCPNGEISTTAYRSGSGDGYNFRFTVKQCTGCPLWDHCRDPDANPKGLRQVFISDYRPLLDAARTYNETDAYAADMKLRPIIEQIIAGLTRYNGARRADRRGTRNADYQAKMNAMAFNIKRWMRLLYSEPPDALAAPALTAKTMT